MALVLVQLLGGAVRHSAVVWLCVVLCVATVAVAVAVWGVGCGVCDVPERVHVRGACGACVCGVRVHAHCVGGACVFVRCISLEANCQQEL